MEILGNAIRNHDQIKSIRVLGTECKLSQYTDDTTLLDSFAALSGLRVNYEKTEALCIESKLRVFQIKLLHRKLATISVLIQNWNYSYWPVQFL